MLCLEFPPNASNLRSRSLRFCGETLHRCSTQQTVCVRPLVCVFAKKLLFPTVSASGVCGLLQLCHSKHTRLSIYYLPAGCPTGEKCKKRSHTPCPICRWTWWKGSQDLKPLAQTRPAVQCSQRIFQQHSHSLRLERNKIKHLRPSSKLKRVDFFVATQAQTQLYLLFVATLRQTTTATN